MSSDKLRTILTINRKVYMARIRLNQEYRNKIANRMRVHLEQEDTVEKQKYDNLKANQIDINDNAWKLAEKIVRRHYTLDDVAKAQYLQDKFENVDTIAKDSCFHFHYIGTKETRDYDNNPKVEEATIEKHFDFRLNGSFDTESNSSIVVIIVVMVMRCLETS